MGAICGAGPSVSYLRRNANLTDISSLDFMFTFWAKMTTDANATIYMMSFSDADDNSGTRPVISSDTASTNSRARISNDIDATQNLGGLTDFPLSTWRFFVHTTDGTKHVGAMYAADGTLLGSNSTNNMPSFSFLSVDFGRRTAAATQYHIGQLAYMRLFKGKGTLAEGLANRTSPVGVPGVGQTLRFNWKTTTDDSGNGYNPTLLNVTTDSDFPAEVVVGSNPGAIVGPFGYPLNGRL